MGKLRVYELAKELGVNTKDLMNVLKELGADVKTNFSTLEDSAIVAAKDMLKQRGVRVREDGNKGHGGGARPMGGGPARPAAPTPPPAPEPAIRGRLIPRAQTQPPPAAPPAPAAAPPAPAPAVTAAAPTPAPAPAPAAPPVAAAPPAARPPLPPTGAPAAGPAAPRPAGPPPVPGTVPPATPGAPPPPGMIIRRPMPPQGAPGAPVPPQGAPPRPAGPPPQGAPGPRPMGAPAPGAGVPRPPGAPLPPGVRPAGPPPQAGPGQPPVRPVGPPQGAEGAPRPGGAAPAGPPMQRPPMQGAPPQPGAMRPPQGQAPVAPGGPRPAPPQGGEGGPRPPQAGGPPQNRPPYNQGGPPQNRPPYGQGGPQRPPYGQGGQGRPPYSQGGPPQNRPPYGGGPGGPRPQGGGGYGGPRPQGQFGGRPGGPGGPPRGPMGGPGGPRPGMGGPMAPPAGGPPFGGGRPGAFGGRGGGYRGGRPQGRDQRDREREEGRLRPPSHQRNAPLPQVVVEKKPITLPEYITVAELASRLEISANDIIKTLMKQGLMVSVNQTLTFDRASQIASAFGFEAQTAPEEEQFVEEPDDPSTLLPRPPVITVLGHVDHGKTSLLDAIRKTNVTAGEAGGITQRIGAYMVEHNHRKITFLDTPGHEAFTAMRARGAQVTDVAVLVVAADDGVKPQTIEALNHARAAKVPIIVALNKIDKPGANVDRVKQQLADLDLLGEDWGGQTVMVNVSAKQNLGIDELLDMILLVADMQELKANPHKRGIGTIIEAKLDKGLGPVATVLISNGTLTLGDAVVVGNVVGKVRALINDHGDRVRKATPSTPVEIIGLETVPQAGDTLHVVDDEKLSRQIVTDRLIKDRETRMQAVSRTSLDDLFRQMKEGEVKDLNVIIKADGQGSVEALKHSLSRLSNNEVRINVIHGGVGTITESDIMLATTSNSMIVGFNVRPDPTIKRLAEQENIDIRLYRVIYHVIEDVKAAMTGMLEPEFEETMLGRAQVRQVFKVTNVGMVAGCMVTDGKIARDADVRVLRDGVVVYEGKVESLRRFKDDVREVSAGYECGIGVSKFPGIQEGDVLEAYQMKEVARTEPAGEKTEAR